MAKLRFLFLEAVAVLALVPGAAGAFDVFVHDRQTAITTRVSVDSAGTPRANGSRAQGG